MGINPTSEELRSLPGVPGECFSVLQGDGPVTITHEQRQFLLWTLGSMEHLRFYADGYPRAVARATFSWPNVNIGDH